MNYVYILLLVNFQHKLTPTYIFYLANGSLRIPIEKQQFNYKKLTNEISTKSKPERPPQPNFDTSREGVLIDISPDESTLSSLKLNDIPRPASRAVSLLDEPIDVPQDDQINDVLNAPPPYQGPPSYYNTSIFAKEPINNDPFDTSNVYNVDNKRFYSQINPTPFTNTLTTMGSFNGRHYIHGDIANRCINYVQNDIVTSKTVVTAQKDVAMALECNKLTKIENNLKLQQSPTKSINNTVNNEFLADLEKSLTISTTNKDANNFPILEPPPKPVKKLTNLTYTNLNDITKNNDDTTSVFNKIWFDTNVQNNEKFVVDTELGQFKSNRRYDPVYCPTKNLYNQTTTELYSNGGLYAAQPAFVGNSSAYSNITRNSLYGVRQYSDVSDGLYTEIPENVYSQVPDETLKPHRPAPPSPGIALGQPLSMQQIQRKIQQGAVILNDLNTFLRTFYLFFVCS